MLPIAPTLLRFQALAVLAVTAMAVTGAQAQALIPCDKAEAPLHVEAVAEIRRHMAAAWLEIGHSYYSGYRMKAPPANPFDLTMPKTEPGAKQVEEGYI